CTGAVALIGGTELAVVGARCRGRGKSVAGTGRRDAVALLGDVAIPGGRAAARTRVARRMRARPGAVATIDRARKTVVGTGEGVRLRMTGGRAAVTRRAIAVVALLTVFQDSVAALQTQGERGQVPGVEKGVLEDPPAARRVIDVAGRAG